MTEADAQAEIFLDRVGWATARRVALAGDASSRRYQRLFHSETPDTAILMIAGTSAAKACTDFIAIARHLSDHGFSAPRILAAEPERGLILLEDLGDDLVARLCADDPAQEPALYAAATDTLIALSRVPCPDVLPRYTPAFMAEAIAPAFDWYAPGLDPGPLPACLHELLTRWADRQDRLGLRDFHAENLIWLPDRAGVARMGLLDFQDAMAGPSAYDLVSLLQDARRDLAPGLAEAMLQRFAEGTGQPLDTVTAACHVLGAQRNLRILGIFAALSQRDGKTRYIDLIPRVWRHLMTNLAHPALAPLADPVEQALPRPDPAYLKRLRTPCPTPS